MYSSGASYISSSWTFYKVLLPCIVLTIIFSHIWVIESYLLSSLFSQLQLQVREWVLNRNSWVFIYYHLYFSTSSESMSSKKKKTLWILTLFISTFTSTTTFMFIFLNNTICVDFLSQYKMSYSLQENDYNQLDMI